MSSSCGMIRGIRGAKSPSLWNGEALIKTKWALAAIGSHHPHPLDLSTVSRIVILKGQVNVSGLGFLSTVPPMQMTSDCTLRWKGLLSRQY